MSFNVLREDALRTAADHLVLGHFSDERPLTGTPGRLDWTLNAVLSRAWRKRPDLLDFGRMTLAATEGKFPFPRILLVGLGPRARFSREERREAYRIALLSASRVGAGRLAVESFPLGGKEADGMGASEQDLRQALDSLPRPPAEVVFLEKAPPAARRVR